MVPGSGVGQERFPRSSHFLAGHIDTRYTSMSNTSNTFNDPRDSSRETRLTLPKSWKVESVGELLGNVETVKAWLTIRDVRLVCCRCNGLDGYVLRWHGDGNKE